MALTALGRVMISDVPFNGPIAGVRVGRVDGRLIINPTNEERGRSDLDLIVAGSRDAAAWWRGAPFLSEDEVLEAIWFGHAGLQPLLAIQEELAQAVGKPKRAFTPPAEDTELLAKVRELSREGLAGVLATAPKLARYAKVAALKQEVLAALGEAAVGKENLVAYFIDRLESETMRAMILDQSRRVDGRDLTTVRPITCEVGLLPRAHGSALFTRGETQALVTCTLGTSGDEQRIGASPRATPSATSCSTTIPRRSRFNEAKMLRARPPRDRPRRPGPPGGGKVLPPRRTSPTRSGGQQTSWRATAPPPWPRSAVPPWPSWTPACRSRTRWPGWPWASSRRASGWRS